MAIEACDTDPAVTGPDNLDNLLRLMAAGVVRGPDGRFTQAAPRKFSDVRVTKVERNHR